LRRIFWATLLSGLIGAGVLAAPMDKVSDHGAVQGAADKGSATGPAADLQDSPGDVVTAAVRQSIGAPARVDIGDQATERLSGSLMIVPRAPAARLLTVSKRPVPDDFQALLVGSESMDAPGIIRFVPAGFVDSNAALAWTADDVLASLKDTVERDNPERAKNNLEPREVRRWVRPPHYDPESHQLTWAALILPKSAPRESDGEVTYHAIGFGREGYVELSVVSSVQKAEVIGQMTDDFLTGLNFLPNKAYGDALPTDRRAAGGLAGAMGLASLHRADGGGGLLAGDRVVPVAGGIVAAIGALALIIYIQRQLRRDARRG
jgi:uncharacterized membrane-anchored protein